MWKEGLAEVYTNRTLQNRILIFNFKFVKSSFGFTFQFKYLHPHAELCPNFIGWTWSVLAKDDRCVIILYKIDCRQF